MPLQFKIDVLTALKEKGITTYMIRKEKIMSESTVQKLRSGKGLAWDNIETLCRLLECQPGDLLEYVPDTEEVQKWNGGGLYFGRKILRYPDALSGRPELPRSCLFISENGFHGCQRYKKFTVKYGNNGKDENRREVLCLPPLLYDAT